MFKLFNLVITIYLSYLFFNCASDFNKGYQVALETANYATMLYQGLNMLLIVLALLAIYIVIFGGTEMYVTTQGVPQTAEED